MKVGIYGYGNLGKGVECAITKAKDMECFGVFTRRNPETVKTLTGVKVYPSADVLKYKDDIDVMIICGGSATDLPKMTPELALNFNVIDSFDTHARIKEHYTNVDKSAKTGSKLAVISCGWDPGMFSLNRILASAILPYGENYTFWGPGVSQGHSDAIRRIPGVKDARQYTIPVKEAVRRVRNGECPELGTRDKHTRDCYVVAEEGADKNLIEKTIKEMPNYFADYDTTVTFISEEELRANHKGLPHGGVVLRSGKTGIDNEHTEIIEYRLTLDSNPEFTGAVLTCAARAAYRMHSRGECGCRFMMDIAPADMSELSREELMSMM